MNGEMPSVFLRHIIEGAGCYFKENWHNRSSMPAGFRVAMMTSRLGVIENRFESFMIDVYKRGNNLGLTPESIASYLRNLIEFSKTIPFLRYQSLFSKR